MRFPFTSRAAAGQPVQGQSDNGSPREDLKLVLVQGLLHFIPAEEEQLLFFEVATGGPTAGARAASQEEVGGAGAAVAIHRVAAQGGPSGRGVTGLFQQFPPGGGAGFFARFDEAANHRQRGAFQDVFRLPKTKETALDGLGHDVDKIGRDDPGPALDDPPVRQFHRVHFHGEKRPVFENRAAGQGFPAFHAERGFNCGKRMTSRMLSWPPLVFLGEISYSMYILQHPANLIYKKYLAKYAWTTLGLDESQLFYLFFLGFLLLCALTYTQFETPLRRFITALPQRLVPRPNTPVPSFPLPILDAPYSANEPSE